MCAPVITSITFDQASYTPGQIITATVNYTSCCANAFSTGGQDTNGREWNVTFDDTHNVAILQATA